MEWSKKYLPGRRKKEIVGRVFATSEEVSEQHAFSLYKWGRSKEYCSRRFGATHPSHPLRKGFGTTNSCHSRLN